MALKHPQTEPHTWDVATDVDVDVEPGRTYPFFVYGTLRPGEHNHARFLADVTTYHRAATLAGASMFDGPGFPYVTRGGPGTVTGELIWVSVDDYDTTLRRLDHLEGYRGAGARNDYDRVLVEATTDTGSPVAAWVYVAGPRAPLATGRRIESGDWRAPTRKRVRS